MLGQVLMSVLVLDLALVLVRKLVLGLDLKLVLE